MSNSVDCECNDYSQLTANTGIAVVKDGNPNLNGNGNLSTLFTAGASGSILKSVIVKSTIPTQAGMIRLFINKGATKGILFKEIPVPVQPILSVFNADYFALIATPMYVSYVICNTELEAGDVVEVSSQLDGTFNVIAEGVDIAYPVTTPDVCCSFKQELPNTGTGVISVANPSNDGTGDIVNIFTADNTFNGSTISSITIEALQSTNEGLVRLYISPDSGTTYYLYNEISIPQTIQAGAVPAFKLVIPQQYNLKAGYIIAASTATAQSFGITIQATKWTYPS